MILSILTPSVESRQGQLRGLNEFIALQVRPFDLPVEHRIHPDLRLNKDGGPTVGEKRDWLIRHARGRYVAFVDDDDWIADDYVAEILRATAANPDVICFRQHCTVNGEGFEVDFNLEHPSGEQGFQRKPWHVCAWRRDIAICSSFPAINYGEDRAWARPLWASDEYRRKKEGCGFKQVHIPKVLHYYRHDSKTTEAPPP